MTITLDLPDELVKNADVYAQTKRLSLAEIIERQLRGLLLEYPKQTKISKKDEEIDSFADCFGAIPDFNLDLDALRGRNERYCVCIQNDMSVISRDKHFMTIAKFLPLKLYNIE